VQTAIHEIGHTLISIYSHSTNEFHKVTIIPRGMALGLTWSTEEEYRVSISEKQLHSEMKTLLGGRIAEEIIFGRENVTTGASNDMERCSAIARAMITQYGMNKDLGIVTYGEKQGSEMMGQVYTVKNYSEEYAKRIDEEVRALVQSLYDEVKIMLQDHKEELLGLSQMLLQKETLDRSEVFDVIEQIQQGKLAFIPFEDFEGLAKSRTPERVEAQLKEEAEERRKERERLRTVESERNKSKQGEK
jgi:cell division protease FtsH